jgi:tRNA(Ile)-lysidine synthase
LVIIDWFSYHTLWLGFSGGLDSSVLLHQLTQIPSLKPKIKLIHVHHGLSPNADAWALHAQKIADAYDIPIFIERVALDSPGNIESKARQLRYSQFKKHVKQGDALLLAHHEDDQAETLLLNLMRGTGIDGLSGMRACRSFHEGTLLRPLLQISRQSLEEYALEHSIRYIHDESNFDTSYRREFYTT